MPENVFSPHPKPYRTLHQKVAGALWRRPQQARTLSAAVISVMLHVLALWLIMQHRPVPPLSNAGSGDTVTTMLMVPDSRQRTTASTRAPVAARPPPAPVVKTTPPPRRSTRPMTPRVSPFSSTPQETIALDKSVPAVTSSPPAEAAPEDDFSARLAARQRQRAAAETQERAQQEARGTPEQQDNERGKQIALANIASQLRSAGLERDDTNGLFQLQHVGPHHAEFLFRGWKKEARRNWSQQLDVEQGTETTIRIAVVKKMIEIIRQYTQADFTWESRRLGKQIHLSARLEDALGLQQFLLREFFPDSSASD